jgi:hypothetical protein
MVAIDATILLLIVNPNAGKPRDSSGKIIPHVPERIDYLIEEFDRSDTTILVPTPALSEVLVRTAPAETQRILDELQRSKVFRIEAFDTRAAVEVSRMTRDALPAKKRSVQDTWAKVKYDMQIVAIAKVNSASAIYSDDEDLRKIAQRADIECVGLADMPLPPANSQIPLDLDQR